jgi:hypothetical protein
MSKWMNDEFNDIIPEDVDLEDHCSDEGFISVWLSQDNVVIEVEKNGSDTTTISFDADDVSPVNLKILNRLFRIARSVASLIDSGNFLPRLEAAWHEVVMETNRKMAEATRKKVNRGKSSGKKLHRTDGRRRKPRTGRRS